MSMKNPLTPAGIELSTFRIVAQYLNHCATAVPVNERVLDRKNSKKSGVKKKEEVFTHFSKYFQHRTQKDRVF